MEIIIAKKSGLCYGVKRAVHLAKETRRKTAGRVSTLGDLVHNPQVVDDLKSRGIDSARSLDALNKGTVIIRSHGVSPEVYTTLLRKKMKIVDATCPIVKNIQKLVAALAKDKKEIIIVGNKEHPEIQALTGHSRGKAVIVEDKAQAAGLPFRRKRAVLAQSTEDRHLFENVVAALIEKTEELTVYNTICHATQTRQKSTSELASRVDTLFIVGGGSSSNTRKLFQISKRILPNTHFIEYADQITPEMLKGAMTIGISGGASTPPEAIREAVAKIKDSFKKTTPRENFVQCQS